MLCVCCDIGVSDIYMLDQCIYVILILPDAVIHVLIQRGGGGGRGSDPALPPGKSQVAICFFRNSGTYPS